MNVCYTALFGNYEDLKTPTVITPGWKYICYTDQPVTSTVWEIKPVEQNPRYSPQLTARYFKLMEWTEWSKSIWVDASFIIATDLNIWWDTHFKGGLSAPGHPLRNDVYEECLDCIIAKRGDKDQVEAQMNEYKLLNIPKHGGLITSGILMRVNTKEVIFLCCAWWEEVKTHSIRDQIAFCRVSLGCNFVNMYRFDYRQNKDFLYRQHFNKR